MTSGHKDTPKMELRGPKCLECDKIYHRRHNHPNRGWFCDQRLDLCPVTEDGVLCRTRKSKSQPRCDRHPLPPPTPKCNVDGCQLNQLDRSQHCHLHACTFAGCPKYARPGYGEDFCNDHKCPEPKCESIRKRSEVGERLEWALFCRDHECETKSCLSKKFPGKDHCPTHCCEMKDCRDARLPRLRGPFCLAHYEELVGRKAASQREAELKAEQQAQALKEAEEREKQQKEDLKLARKLEKEERQAEAEARFIRREQEAQLKAQEAEKARLKEAEEARLQEEVEARLREERKKYQSERQWEKSPRSSGEDFYGEEGLKARMKDRFEKFPGERAHYYEDPHLKPEAAHRDSYKSSPRSSGSFYEIPNISRPRPRGEEQPRYGMKYPKTSHSREKGYVYIHNDDDELYHSAPGNPEYDEHLPPGRRNRGSSSASDSGLRGEFRRAEKEYVREDGTGPYYNDLRSEIKERERERGGRERNARYDGYEGKENGKGGSKDGW